MPTTVNYKGSALTSFTNSTKTLTTSGKYLEDNIEIISTEQTEIPIGVGKDSYIFTSLGFTWSSSAEENI